MQEAVSLPKIGWVGLAAWNRSVIAPACSCSRTRPRYRAVEAAEAGRSRRCSVRGGRRTRRVFLVRDGGQLRRNPELVGPALFADLVADAPQNDRGMIAVAAEFCAKVAFVPVVEEQVIIIPRLAALPAVSAISSITSIPILSQRSSSSGDAGLWLVRMALQPNDFKISIWRSRPRSLITEPSGPRSLWLQTPLMGTRWPFRRNPVVSR